jgi:hypothetical protein
MCESHSKGTGERASARTPILGSCCAPGGWTVCVSTATSAAEPVWRCVLVSELEPRGCRDMGWESNLGQMFPALTSRALQRHPAVAGRSEVRAVATTASLHTWAPPCPFSCKSKIKN